METHLLLRRGSLLAKKETESERSDNTNYISACQTQDETLHDKRRAGNVCSNHNTNVSLHKRLLQIDKENAHPCAEK